MAALSDYLKQNESKSFFVVGHTDGSGGYDYNVRPSEQRAVAVVNALMSEGVAARRLRAVGVGPVAPNANNETDEGLIANRRVELVEDVGK